MRTNVLRPIHIGLALLIALPVLAADFSVEPAGSPPVDGVPEAVTAMLHGEGVRVMDPDGTVVAEFWGRKSAFEGDPVSGFGIRFTTIPEGALVGLVQFPDKGSDYREQHIPAGIYTLRYGLHPEDGDHMGAAPSRDFVLLTPAAADTEASRNYGFDDLVELSYKVGNSHPTIARAEIADGDGSPNIWQNDLEQWVVDLQVTGEPIGIIVYGHADE
ncbi:MAG: hypothetical protein OXB98_20380 [Bryobacterales bacterium]|nr:hypothetical protein [Bryobacterales bacterium]